MTNKNLITETDVTKLLFTLGVAPHLKGFRFIKESVILILKEPDVLDNITKVLYPTIAQQFNTTPSRVERAVRHAIENAWTKGNPEVLNNLFGYTINATTGKPTNSQFIATVAEALKLDLIVRGF